MSASSFRSFERGTMQSPKKTTKKPARWKVLLPIILVLLVAGAAGGYWYWTQLQAKKSSAATAASALKTAQVRTGNMTISASGTGTLIPGAQNSLGFSSSGNIAVLNVQVGSQVKKGDVLAQLDTIDTLKANITVAEQALVSAQADLDTLKQSGAANIANAQLTLAADQKALTDAQAALVNSGMPRCDQPTTDQYYQNYLVAKQSLDNLGNGDGSRSFYLYYIVPAKNKVAQAYSTYIWCTGYTTYEIDSSHANLALAQAKVQTDQTTLDTLQKNGGIDPATLAQAENKVSSAQLDLDNAKQTLADATIVAPYDGTILAVNGQVGDSAGTGTVITIADLAHPQIEFYIDETDAEKLSIGETANVVFDSLPNQTFTGKVTSINPSLVTSGNTQAIQAWATIDLSNEKNIPTLLAGMSASVDVINANASNAILVPIAALRDLGSGNYAVFVVGADGKLKLTPVKVGLMDSANAQIVSGLKAGETVSTGVTQVKSSTSGN
jgi:HlyD family secretion protein